MKTAHHLAKILATEFGILPSDALKYIEFATDQLEKRFKEQTAVSIVLPLVGYFVLYRASLQKKINEYTEKILGYDNPELYRSMRTEVRDTYRQRVVDSKEKWVKLLEQVEAHNRLKKENYDNKIRRYLARKVLGIEVTPKKKTDYSRFKGPAKPVTLQDDTGQPSTAILPLDQQTDYYL